MGKIITAKCQITLQGHHYIIAVIILLAMPSVDVTTGLIRWQHGNEFFKPGSDWQKNCTQGSERQHPLQVYELRYAPMPF